MQAYHQAVIRLLSGQETLDDVVATMDIPRKQLKRYLYSHGYMRTLDMPIILFDLNGTLCHRTERNRVIMLRPHITELKRLKRIYRIGVYTSVTRYNALAICDYIEDICGRIFDRNLIFTREHTFPFNEEERAQLNLKPYKMKKSIDHILCRDAAAKATIIDDEIVRVVEKEKTIQIDGWYGDNVHDEALMHIVDKLVTVPQMHKQRQLFIPDDQNSTATATVSAVQCCLPSS